MAVDSLASRRFREACVSHAAATTCSGGDR
jgi:hypothetical protein